MFKMISNDTLDKHGPFN